MQHAWCATFVRHLMASTLQALHEGKLQDDKSSDPTTMPAPIMCKFFLERRCMKGSSCSFIHNVPSADHESSLSQAQFMGKRTNAATTLTPPCKFFLANKCTKADACPFPHTGASPTLLLDPGHMHAGAKAMSTCTFYSKGICKKGSLCPFRHPEFPGSTSGSPSGSQQAHQSIPTTTVTLCKFFERGKCEKGDDCRFSHDAEVPQEKNIQNGVLKTDIATIASSDQSLVQFTQGQAPDEPASFHPLTTTRSFLNCEVEFGAGASVNRIITSFESSRIILSNLPLSVTEADLINLLGPLDGLVKFSIFKSTATATARVLFQGCDQAERARQYLDDRAYDTTRLAARLDLRGTVENGSGTLLSRKLKLSWFAPSVIAWAQYPDIATARRRAQELDGKTFDGRKLAVSFQIPKTRIQGRFSSHPYFSSSCHASIEIKGLPLHTKEFHLQRFTRASSVTIGDPSYDLDDALEEIRILLNSLGSLDSFELLPVDNKKPKIMAFAQFSSSEAAIEAANKLHNVPQECLRHTPLWAEQIHSVKYSVSFKQFMALKKDLDQLRVEYGNVGSTKLHYYDSDENGRPVNPVYVQIYGPDAKLLGRLKVAIERVLGGEQVVLNGCDVWDDYFETREGQQFVDDINKGLACFVKCDTRTRTLRLSGNYAARDAAKRLISEQLEVIRATRHVLPLEKEKLRGLLMGGLKALCDEVGMDKVVLDVVALTITVRGDENDVRRVRQAILNVDSANLGAVGSVNLCPVCFCDLTDPIGLSCGHSYCMLCLQHLLRSHINTSFSDQAVTCVVEDEVERKLCGAPIQYQTIRQLLQPAEETALLEASFLSHIHARREEFRYCPTPDCKVIYRRQVLPANLNGGSLIFQCHACLTRVCAGCHVEFHEGLSCAEHIDNQRGGYQALLKWKSEHGIKSCPKCDADLEKNGGCNHITCVLCGTHICWVCMMTFSQGGRHVYDHMLRSHGGIGIEDGLAII